MVDAGKTKAQVIEEARITRKISIPAISFGLLPVLVCLALVIGLRLFPPSVKVFEPHYLLPLFNSLLFLAAFVIASIALRSYLMSGAAAVLWLGCGVLTLGAGALAAGWLIYPFGPNANVTIFNVAVLLSSICHAGGVLSTLEARPGDADPGRRRRKAAFAYPAALTAIALLVVLTLAGIIPPFFIQGLGPTVLRQYVVEWSLVLLIFASLVIMQRFLRKRAPFHFWYSLALALVAISMLAFFLQPAVGSPIGWVGRSAYVLAAVYFLLSANSAWREARTRGVGLSETLAELFSPGLHWQGIMATVSDAIVSYNDQGEILLWNQAAERIFGYPEAEVVGKSIDLILPDRKAAEAPRLNAGVSELELVRQNGSRFNAEISVSTRQSPLGALTTLVIRDVTARQQAEKAQAASRARFEAIFNSISDAVIFVDQERRMALLNPAVEALFGYPPEKLLGRTTEILYADPAEYVRQGNLRYREDASANQTRSEIKYRRQDGTVFHAESLGLPVNDLHGHSLGFVGIHRDITERQRAEEALRESEARFRSLFENMTEGVALHELLCDDHGLAVDYRIVSTNPAFEKHTGLKSEQVQGQLASIAYGTGSAPYLEEFARVARTGQAYAFETMFSPMQRHFRISVTSPKQGQFVTVFEDITERKLAEREIQRLASFPQMSPQPVLEVGIDGRITYYNQAALKALGPTGRAADLKNFLPDDLPDMIATAMQTGEKHFHREVAVNGGVFLENLFFAAPSKVMRLYAFDITDRQRIEAALRRAKEEWERTFDAVPDLIFILDHEHRIVRSNRAMTEALGLEPSELVGRTCYEAVHGLPEPPDFCPHSKLLQDGQPHTAEVLELGREFLVTVSPFLFAEGRAVGSVHVARDITDHKQAEAALRDSEERFRTMANAIPQLAWTADRDGYLSWYNQRWYDYTGTTAADMQGWGWQKVHDPEMLPEVLEQWRISLATGRPFDMVFPLRGADGQFREFLTRVMPMKDSDGQVIQWFGTNTDITERQHAEEALRRSYHRLDLLAETASQLLGSVSPQKVVDAICLKVMEFLHCDAFFNFLQDEQEGRLYLNAYAGIPEEEARRIQCLDYGAAVCGCAAQDGRRIVTEDILNANDPRTDLVKSYGIQAYACHPLLVEGRVLGTLSFGTRSRSHFTLEELTLMNAVADQVAIAMDRQQADAELRRLNEELEQRVENRTAELQATVDQLEEEVRDRQQAEQQAASRSRLYRLLSLVSEATVRAQDQEGLFRQTCRIMMEEGDFLLCWIGRVDREAGVVRAAAQIRPR